MLDVQASVDAMGRQGLLLSGIPAMKCPEDLERYQTVVEAIVRVATVVAGQGGDFLVYAQCPEGYVPISGGLYTNDVRSG